jgi:hypothetical protein
MSPRRTVKIVLRGYPVQGRQRQKLTSPKTAVPWAGSTGRVSA